MNHQLRILGVGFVVSMTLMGCKSKLESAGDTYLKAGDPAGRSGDHRPRRTPRMVMFGGVRIVIKGVALERAQQVLDVAFQMELLELVEQLAREQGMAVLMVTHELNLAAEFAHLLKKELKKSRKPKASVADQVAVK